MISTSRPHRKRCFQFNFCSLQTKTLQRSKPFRVSSPSALRSLRAPSLASEERSPKSAKALESSDVPSPEEGESLCGEGGRIFFFFGGGLESDLFVLFCFVLFLFLFFVVRFFLFFLGRRTSKERAGDSLCLTWPPTSLLSKRKTPLFSD